MSLHTSLKPKGRKTRRKGGKVRKRGDRLEILKKNGRYEEGMYYGLPKGGGKSW